eukprot:TRINITY_DN12780_c0_g1_i1.p1 TRINITY_DN12780_c0_g1~~TRINITY_DN12780_c0_g1_i1.p1  ORF type:complete len:430 (+),score=46.26 TRINITY_DN12780_c0_g1_i1:70-1359(+)
MPGRPMTRAERRKQRVSDLRLMGLATVAVLMCMVTMLVWMHATQGVKEQLNRLNGGGNDLQERRRGLMQKIVSTRKDSELQLRSDWLDQRNLDNEPTRTPCQYPVLTSWQGRRRPCPPYPKRTAILIVTEHFGPSTTFLLPHYDELGVWQLSLQEPTLWNINVTGHTETRQLYCGEQWLSLTHVFDPLGSVDSKVLHEVNSKRESQNLQQLLSDSTFRKGMIVAVTHNTTAFKDQTAEHPEARLMAVFTQGMEHIIDHLVPKKVSLWGTKDIEEIHELVCKDEPGVDIIGKIRPETLHVGYGFSTPPPLGFEIRYLMDLYAAWLEVISEETEPLLYAIQSFAVLHRMQPFENCNTRVAKLVMNALLIKNNMPPLHMFLHTTKQNLRRLEGLYYDGKPNELIDFFADSVLSMQHLIDNNEIADYAGHAIV